SRNDSRSLSRQVAPGEGQGPSCRNVLPLRPVPTAGTRAQGWSQALRSSPNGRWIEKVRVRWTDPQASETTHSLRDRRVEGQMDPGGPTVCGRLGEAQALPPIRRLLRWRLQPGPCQRGLFRLSRDDRCTSGKVSVTVRVQ